MRQINRASKLPLYHQLYQILRSNITGREWQPGDMIPPESELIERYQVSRTTVRQVLDILANEGLIYRQQGRGTFVAHPTVEHGLVRIVNFTEDMRMRGCEPSSKVLFSGLVPAPQDIAEKLQVELGEELARLERLRLADGEPMGVEESYLVHRYCPGVLQKDYVSSSLRETLVQDYDIRWTHARQTIRAILASRDLAELLAIRPKSALLFLERVSFSQQNIPVEFLRIYYRADRYVLYNELQA
jgi:GntR family transcriptional regulator